MMVMRCVQVHIKAALRDAGIQHVVSEDADYGRKTSPRTCIREVNDTDIYAALRCVCWTCRAVEHCYSMFSIYYGLTSYNTWGSRFATKVTPYVLFEVVR